jgi:hypothetical protein
MPGRKNEPRRARIRSVLTRAGVYQKPAKKIFPNRARRLRLKKISPAALPGKGGDYDETNKLRSARSGKTPGQSGRVGNTRLVQAALTRPRFHALAGF